MTKQYKIAVPIVAENFADVTAQSAESINRGANILEFRLDRIKDLSVHQLWQLSNNFRGIQKIYTNRHRDESGSPEFGYKGREEERLGILRMLASVHDPDYLDIEYKHTNDRNFKPIRKGRNTKIIVSYHDFKQTPDYDKLKQIYHDIAGRADCDIVKMAFMIKDDKDNENILRLIEEANKGGGLKPLVAIGMGELGMITRKEGPVKGSPWTFGALSNERQSAPGQPSIEELRAYWKKH